jgi:hypothetical protein
VGPRGEEACVCDTAVVAGLEVIFTLLELKLKNPKGVYMARGNHEDEVGARQPGLRGRARAGCGCVCARGCLLLCSRAVPCVVAQTVNKEDFGGTFDLELREKYPNVPYHRLRKVRPRLSLAPVRRRRRRLPFTSACDPLVRDPRG